MKIIYLLSNDVAKADGILKKVTSQIDSWKQNGVNVTTYCITNSRNKNIKIQGFKFFYVESGSIFKRYMSYTKVYRLIFTELSRNSIDLIYWRFEPFKFGMKRIFKKYQTIVEINADIYEEYNFTKGKNLSFYLRFLNYRFSSDKFFKIIKGFVCVTFEIKERMLSYHPYIKDIIVIPNSIDLNKYKTLKYIKVSPLPVITFMGISGYEWHGIDELITFSNEMKGVLNFNVIGYENSLKNKKSDNIKFYGHLSKEDYIKIFEQTDVAVGVLALYKKGLAEACPLKVREYLAYGLPIIQAHDETIFINTNIKPDWFLILPNEEGALLDNKKKVLEFCYKYAGKRYMESRILKLIDSNSVELERLAFFKSCII